MDAFLPSAAAPSETIRACSRTHAGPTSVSVPSAYCHRPFLDSSRPGSEQSCHTVVCEGSEKQEGMKRREETTSRVHVAKRVLWG